MFFGSYPYRYMHMYTCHSQPMCTWHAHVYTENTCNKIDMLTEFSSGWKSEIHFILLEIRLVTLPFITFVKLKKIISKSIPLGH